MQLTFTRYVDNRPAVVELALDEAISTGIVAAAGRVAADVDAIHTATIEGGRRIETGLAPLEGSEVRISGHERLTVVEIAVPWSGADQQSDKLWAANRFASVVANHLSAAA